MSAKNPISEEAVSWKVEELDVQATLSSPSGQGPFPAVIFVAGSGPTDRNWNTPLIPGTNGAGALLARELTDHGFITLRYDKLASGPQGAENAKHMQGKVSMQSHVAELSGGVNLLASRMDVNPGQIFVLTNSEGCVHALNYQTQSGSRPFKAMVLTSAFARATGEVARGQLAAQFGAVPGGDAMMAGYDAAMKEFAAERPVPIDENLPVGLQQLIQAITMPISQPFARELWIFNPVEKLGAVKVPVLIVIGKKDIQVDWQTDGPLFETVAKHRANINLVYLENANHVMKFEPKPRSELTPAEVMVSYGSDEVMLDPQPVETIISWLKAQL